MSIDKLVGIGSKITLRDKEYLMSPLTIRDMGEIDTYVKAQRLKVFETANPNLTIREKIEIANETPTEEEINNAVSNIPGVIFQLWLYLRKNHPELTVGKIGMMIDKDNLRQVTDALESMVLTQQKKMTEEAKESA